MQKHIILITLLIIFSCESDSNGSGKITTDGLFAHYALDGNANDDSGNSNNGTMHGALTSAQNRDGDSGKSLTFNGNDGYISVPNMTRTDFDSSFVTITAWVFINSFQNDAKYPLFSKEDDSVEGEDAAASEFAFWIDDSGIDFQPYGRISRSFDTNKWYFVAIRMFNNNVSLSVDGSLVGFNDDAGLYFMGNQQFNIGASLRGANSYFDGKMDDIRIYNRILSDNELKAIRKE